MVYGDKGGAVGYLVGEENRGLACMFTMMNLARLAVGLQGVGIAERATQQALQYARERKQGRALGATSGSSAIIEHPDVKRMLMTMRALTRAARAICYATAGAIDGSHGKGDSRQGSGRPRGAAHADRQGVLDRHRHRGRFARRAGAWRHGLHRGDRRGAASSRRADRRDLRRHQRHPGDRSGDAQDAAVRRRRGARLSRRIARHGEGGAGHERSGVRRDRRAACRSGRQPRPRDRVAPGQGREGARRPRSPAPRPICGCSAMPPAAACWPTRRWRRSASPTASRPRASPSRASSRRTSRCRRPGWSAPSPKAPTASTPPTPR